MTSRASDEIENTIREMQRDSILWDSKHPKFFSHKRTLAIRQSAKRIGINIHRFADIIKYIKREYYKTQKKLESDGMNKNKMYWKWYDYCSFLQETGNDQSSRKTLNTNHSFNLSSDDNSNQSHFENFSAAVEGFSGPSKSSFYNKVPQPQSHQLDSTTLTNPEISEMDIKPEGNYFTEEQYQLSDSAGHVLPRDMDGEVMERDASDKREGLDKKFLIKGVCSAVEYHLSNDRITEDDVIEFHGFIVKSMHSYFKNKYK
ncbi:uncharacterized protein LOC129802110 [Phlebotomus papatasi]|uniref:uncharacterized protein LOC129802110 n=1 Tax=Phlebotomus papatasi TaxID=29031 RepID=UPI0024845EAB|nr:uncharacterized protein LOC129802110 [Phlebotomus papatasi]